jgi:hypothetical protein
MTTTSTPQHAATVRVGSPRDQRMIGWGLITLFVVFAGLVVAQATSATTARIVEHTGGAGLIGSMDASEYASIVAIEYASAPSILRIAASVLLWAGFATLVTMAARRIGTPPLALVALVASWIAFAAWIVTVTLELLLVLEGGQGFSSGFWTWWFWGQAAVSIAAAGAIGALALSVRHLHAWWRISIAALAGLCVVGAVTVEIPPAASIVLGAALGVALVLTARARSRANSAADLRGAQNR